MGGGAGGGAAYVAADWWRRVGGKALKLLDAYHREYPLRAGMPREEFRSRLDVPTRRVEAVLSGLATDGVLTPVGPRVARAGFEPRLGEGERRRRAEPRR